MEILEEKRAVLADSLGLVWVRHRGAIACAIQGVLGRGVPVIVVVTVKVTVLLAVGGVSLILKGCRQH